MNEKEMIKILKEKYPFELDMELLILDDFYNLLIECDIKEYEVLEVKKIGFNNMEGNEFAVVVKVYNTIVNVYLNSTYLEDEQMSEEEECKELIEFLI